jgi:SAM-dependent methyltransferase
MKTNRFGLTGGQDAFIANTVGTLPKRTRVLTLGCGPNARGDLNELANLVWMGAWQSPKRYLIAADRNMDTVTAARSKFPHPHLLLTIATDARQLALCDGSIDLVLAFGLFGGGLPPKEFNLVLAECRRVLRERGHLLVSNSSLRQDHDDFVTIAEQQGLQHLTTHMDADSGDPRYASLFGRAKASD